MKLATFRTGRPDGGLAVVSRDLARHVSAADIAPTPQAALDDWDALAPALDTRFSALDAGRIAGAPSDPHAAMAPCPAPISGSTPRPS